MGKYNTVVFDLDGTLLNTLDDLEFSLNQMLEAYGYPKRSSREVRKFLGNGIEQLVSLAIPDGMDNPDFPGCLRQFKLIYEKNMLNKTRPYEGITGILAELKKKGLKMAIVSNKFDAAVKELNKRFFSDSIEVSVGVTDPSGKKPSPQLVYKALDALHSLRGDAIYVGDSEVDVQTAKNAGIPCIGVTWGFRDKCVLQNLGAEYIIDKPLELLGIIELEK